MHGKNPDVLNAGETKVAPNKTAPPPRKSSPAKQSVVSSMPVKSPVRGR